ncbi:alpha-amylase family glycosyl hydrolase [Alteromonas sp. RKMC-009]|uniref:alpha-amylase family glycosyl hydrolase n=1 Tax=Alteromonas sp. RKMC-009 TaxID=2267264 RepID=UPI000E68A39A|nr:alpha-amylase family glycosyl hydrolase [Alteromonas sp. RKMC-009]AYA64401.1 cyclomaltodextrin glucanotransferase [Alteromonas sp. RKMC-009]
MRISHTMYAIASVLTLSGCENTPDSSLSEGMPESTNTSFIRGTAEPFSAEAVYFIMTDRFVDGDKQNNYETQGGDHPSWNLPLNGPDGATANVGYMGGDLQGVVNNIDFIKDMGFTAVWLTPVVDNPDQAFTGSEPITFGGQFKDGGKTGYHGYWATNFYQPDEHLISASLSVKDYTTAMHDAGLKTVFDIVANHGSPSFSMPQDQPGFGEIYDAQGKLVADHSNTLPSELDTTQPLQAFFHDYPDLVELSNLDESNPDVQDYLINSYLYWIEQGADAFRIDTIRHVPHHFWRTMSDRIRAEHPGFFMFGESFQYDANFIAQHTLPKNGNISVLDFPMQKAMVSVFGTENAGFETLSSALHLTHGPYHNPYDLTTFYDNHDMPRMNATDDGFIDAHNWLFTSRGIPVVYQGSETGFMRGTAEHSGNRNYYGQDNVDKAPQHRIYQSLSAIAHVRKATPALQRGLQTMLELNGEKAAFYRVVMDDSAQQTALVLLNKGDTPVSFEIAEYMQNGRWSEQLSGSEKEVNNRVLTSEVSPHSVQVWLRDGPLSDDHFIQHLHEQIANL